MALAVVLVVAVSIASVIWGARSVEPSDVWLALQGHQDTIGQAAVAKRLPRTLLALLVGAALALSGAVMQGVTRNPLADPGILGVTAGASLAVVIGIAFFGLASANGYLWVAIVGAGLSAVFVYAVGSAGRGGATPLKLALAGTVTAAAFHSLVSAILLPRVMVMNHFRFWQIGGVGGASYDRITLILPLIVVGTLLCVSSAARLNALALGDELAAGLGERVARARILATVGAVILCGAATAVAGPIGFIGLVVPHACRILIGLDHRWMLPLSILLGGALLTAADVIGRVVAQPTELDVGIVTAFIGAPVFIWLVRRMRVRAL